MLYNYKQGAEPRNSEDAVLAASARIFRQIQAIAFANKKMTMKELQAINTLIAQLLTAPKGLISEC